MQHDVIGNSVHSSSVNSSRKPRTSLRAPLSANAMAKLSSRTNREHSCQRGDRGFEPPPEHFCFLSGRGREWLRQAPDHPSSTPPSPEDGRGHITGRSAVPNDRPELPAWPHLSIDEVRAFRRRTTVETQQEAARYRDLLRETQDLLKRVDEMLARRP